MAENAFADLIPAKQTSAEGSFADPNPFADLIPAKREKKKPEIDRTQFIEQSRRESGLEPSMDVPLYDPNVSLKERGKQVLQGVPLAARAAPYMVPVFGQTPAAAYTSAALGQVADIGVDAVLGQERSLMERGVSAVTDVAGGRMLQGVGKASTAKGLDRDRAKQIAGALKQETQISLQSLPPDVRADFERHLVVSGKPVERSAKGPILRAERSDFVEWMNKRRAPPPQAQASTQTIPDVMLGKGAEQFLAKPISEMPAAREIAGNLNLKNVSGPEDFKKAQQYVIDQFGGLESARRGVRPQAMTTEIAERIAQESGMKPGKLGWKVGRAFNAENIQAQRIITQAARDEMLVAANKAVGGSDADKFMFKEAYTRYLASQEELAGVTAEAGRALNIFRTMPAHEKVRAKWMQDILAKGGRDMGDVAEKLLRANEIDPSQIPRLVRNVRWIDKFNEVFINMLVSGPQSHIANTASNQAVAGISQAENFVAAIISKTPGIGSGEIGFRESFAGARGLVKGLRTGTREFAREVLQEGASNLPGKLDEVTQNAIKGPVGKIVRMPTRLLRAEDAFFQTANYSSEIERLATRAGVKQGLKGEGLRKFVTTTIEKPSEEMAHAAWEAARKSTFNSALGGDWLTEGAKATIGWLNKVPQGRLIIPFVRTPTNIVKYTLERTPAALTFGDVRAALKVGGAARDQALARIAVGSGISALAATASANGQIAGSGPRDPNERARLLETGWQPYSVKVGDKYFQFQRIQPLGMLLGLSADFQQAREYMTDGEADRAAALIALSASRNLLDSTFMSGINNVLDAVDDPERSGPKMLASIAASTVPAIAGQASRAIDPTVRDAQGIIDTALARAGQSASPAKVSLYGEDIKRPVVSTGDKTTDFLVNFVNPVRVSEQSEDKVILETARLFTRDAEQTLGNPIRRIGKVELTQEQYHEYAQMAGRMAKSQLDRIVALPTWDRLTDGIKREIISEIVKENREAAQGLMLNKYEELIAPVIQKKLSRVQ